MKKLFIIIFLLLLPVRLGAAPDGKIVENTSLFKDKVSFTQEDENEYIDSLLDGELDLGATKSFNIRINGTEQLQFFDGLFSPTTDADINLGDATHEFGDLWLDGTGNIDSLVADTVDINGGTIDGTTIGVSAIATGSFTDLTASGDVNLGDGGDTVTIIPTSTVTIGNGAVGIDFSFLINGEDSDGIFTWMEDEDYFSFADNLAIATLTEGSIPYIGAAGVVSENNTDLFWDNTNETLTVGESGSERTITINGTEYKSRIRVSDFGVTNLASFQLHRHSSTAAVGTVIVASRARGNTSSHTIVQDNDNLLDIGAAGWNGNDYSLSSAIKLEVDGTPGDNDMPGRVVLSTSPDGSETLTEAVRIDSSQNTGVGTSTLVTKLNVGGAITIEELSSDPTDPTEGKAVFWMGDGTGSGSDGDLLYMEQSGAVVETGNLKWSDFVPSSITVNASDGTSGSVSDVQTMFDGNVYQIEELSATPGYDIEFVFSNVDKYPSFVVVRWEYSGSATHDVTWDIWNYDSTAWDTLRVFQDSGGYESSMTMYIPRNSNGDYVSAGAAKVRVYHRSAGNASHSIQVDYVGFTHSLQGVI